MSFSISSNLGFVDSFLFLLAGKTLSDKEFKHVLMFWNKFEMKVMKDYHDFC